MTMFDLGAPITVYLSDRNGAIMKGTVTSCILSTDLYSGSQLTVECTDIKAIKKEDIGTIDPYAFECLLEENNGRDPEVQEKVQEEAAEEGQP